MYGLMLGNLNNQDFEDNRITSLACYVKKVEELYSILENENRENKENMDNDGNDSEKIHLENDGKRELYFRGQDSIDYRNTCPSLFRNEKYYANESNMINDFIAKYPDLFKDCQNNVDRLALMQHHQLPTRLLDLTTNALIALYFAVEKDNCKDGVVYVFNNFCNEKFVDKALKKSFSFELDKSLVIPHSNSKVLRIKSSKRDSFSDQVEIETSLARMKQTDSDDFITEVLRFYKELSECDKEIWGKAYLSYLKALSTGIDYSSLSFNTGKLLHKYDNFNNAIPTIRLYHAIERDSGNFDHIINPVEMYLPKIVTPRIIDQRIKNQQGLFMLVPFIFDNKGVGTESLLTKTQRLINTLLYTRRDVHTGKDKAIAFRISCCKKKKLRKELSNIGISKSFIYPDATSYAQDIANSYSKN
ncbi:FRG domain-containing protein [Limosilactobacillus mucosae]|uniref:FRG domain-containing protein n=1 Tax=Limosilactobacillus mucosae TaxID=97478 RepID=A0AAJ1HSB4_LIMMU|nr:FRG domain-containing protein [Limosilactobacillus mucosae]MDC2828770.1 FRG domain-containing protein [Limosilactobacillus mucosae]MDC2836625.1 FRG domain-containing protein [Limosilactobacillus mucosae]MDC2848805.1 FRG domain-containing protein [Limosilactobacillus mucosae]MDC2854357.1 FRG domain-containing protein [Limosilactobacillus mucosae]